MLVSFRDFLGEVDIIRTARIYKNIFGDDDVNKDDDYYMMAVTNLLCDMDDLVSKKEERKANRFLFSLIIGEGTNTCNDDVHIMRYDKAKRIPHFLCRHDKAKDGKLFTNVCYRYVEEDISVPLLLTVSDDIYSCDVWMHDNDEYNEYLMAHLIKILTLFSPDITETDIRKQEIADQIFEATRSSNVDTDNIDELLSAARAPKTSFLDITEGEKRKMIEIHNALLETYSKIRYDL